MISCEAKGASIRLSVDLFPFLSLSSLPQQKILHVNVCNLWLQRSCRGVTASPTRNWTPQPGLPSTSARSFLSSLWRTFRHLALRRYWTLFGGIMSFTKIWIAKDMRINNLTPPVSSAEYPGVHSEPSQHRTLQPLRLTCQRHQLLHWAHLSAGQQLQSLTVSLNL